MRDFPPTGSYAGVRYATPPEFLAEIYRRHPRRKLRDTFASVDYRLP